jgi:hypothetical protein
MKIDYKIVKKFNYSMKVYKGKFKSAYEVTDLSVYFYLKQCLWN